MAVLRRHQHLAAHVSAFLLARELIFEMYTGRAGFDHCLRQFENIERPTEPGFGIRDNRREPINIDLTFGVVDLIGALQRLIDSPNDCRHAVRRIQTLVRIHLAGKICVRRDLPSAHVNCLQSRFDLLHRLVAGERTEGRDVIFALQQMPKFLCAATSERVLDEQTAAHALDI